MGAEGHRGGVIALRASLRTLPIAVAVAAVSLTAALALSIYAVRSSAAISREVEHTATVRTATAQLRQAVVDAETSQRGFLLTGEPALLYPLRDARSRAQAMVTTLRSLTLRNARQEALVRDIERDTADRLAELASVLDAPERGGGSPVREVLGGRTLGQGTMEVLRRDLARMDEEQDSLLLDGRAGRARAGVLAMVALVVTGFLFGLLVVLATAWRRATDAENARLAERARTIEFQDRFIAILGHDLRNPLSSVKMGLGVARRSVPTQALKTIDRMDASVERMERMIQQLLDLARSRFGAGIAVAPAAANLASIVHAVTEELRGAHPARVLVVAATGDLDGAWDADRLQQVVSNLVGNALSYGSLGEPVRIALHGEAERVVLSVHNGGPPIPEPLQKVLFDPFRRGASEAKTASSSGLGLGLYISRALVTAHGGSIELVSSETEGTTFTVTLPRAVRA
jgi:signal transduction histidine kinase